MERLLHYTWQHKLYSALPLSTSDGEPVEVLDPGLHNTNAGPDFFNAKIKLNGEIWVGNVEIHTFSSDWMKHRHHLDENYNNVILHVVENADVEVFTSDGKKIPQVIITVPQYVEENYAQLLVADKYPPCASVIPQMPNIIRNQWLDALCIERLEQKTERLNHYADMDKGNWERAFFINLARSFGFGINSDTFEEWALNLPLGACAKHRDDLFQLEAIFLGQAGLLEESMIPSYHLDFALEEGYLTKLQDEYKFLRHKFSLTPMNGMHWRFLRLRPQNFPHIRLVQLAHLYWSQQISISAIQDINTLEDAYKLLSTHVTPYWETHYGFGAESGKSAKNLTKASMNLLIINGIIPTLFAYGKHRQKEVLCHKALQLLVDLRAENNLYTRTWAEIGLPVSTAADSQALIQLRTQYCDRKDCLRCRFGFYFMKKSRQGG